MISHYHVLVAPSWSRPHGFMVIVVVPPGPDEELRALVAAQVLVKAQMQPSSKET